MNFSASAVHRTFNILNSINLKLKSELFYRLKKKNKPMDQDVDKDLC